jgi:hypothetical protein
MRSWLIVSVVLAACDAYDHDLGPAPFLCGDAEPRCPTDYECVPDQSSDDEICVVTGATAGTVQCADDSALEPNDSLDTAATATAEEHLAICPATDKDTYAIPLASTARVELAVTFERGAPLSAAILNEGGVPVAVGAVDDATRTVHALAETLPAGRYYAQVSSPMRRANNYAMTITTR